MDRKPHEKSYEPPSVRIIRAKDVPFSPLPDFPRTKSLKDLLGTRSWESLEALPLTEARKS